MKEYGLPFCGELIPKVIDGSKTQTRRKPNPINCFLTDAEGNRLRKNIWTTILWDNPQTSISYDGHTLYTYRSFEGSVQAVKITPRVSVGDIIWMREAHCFPNRNYRGDDPYFKNQPILYRINAGKTIDKHTFNDNECRWRPSIFLHRCNSRKDLVVKEIKFQWLQSLTEEDALDEGIELVDKDFGGNVFYKDYKKYTAGEIRLRQTYYSAIESFSSLWDSINLTRGWGWDLNRPVFVYKFEGNK